MHRWVYVHASPDEAKNYNVNLVNSLKAQLQQRTAELGSARVQADGCAQAVESLKATCSDQVASGGLVGKPLKAGKSAPREPLRVTARGVQKGF